MDADWEDAALAMRDKARIASRTLRKTLSIPRKVPASEIRGIRAGVATADITPTEPVHLDGYWSERLSTAVHDPLTVTALVLDDGRTRVALVIADLIAYFYQWVAEARLQQHAVAPENTVICTTHTHSAPCVLGIFGPPTAVQQTYVKKVGKIMARSIEQATAALRPVRIGFGENRLPLENGESPNFARNWHNPGVLDPVVLLMRMVDAETEAPLANLVNVGNHPDVLGDHSTEISADFFHYVRQHVSDRLGGQTLVFQRGLGGVEPIPQGVNNMTEADAHLKTVAGVASAATLRASEHLEWVDAPRLAMRSAQCRFPVTSGETLKAYAKGILPIAAEDGVQVNEMALIELGPARFLTVPGEPHPEVIFKLSDMMAARYNFVIGMAQDEIGYVVPAELFNFAGIQELLSAGRDNEPVVLDGARRLLGVHGFAEPACFSSQETTPPTPEAPC